MQHAVKKGKLDRPEMICNAVADRLIAGSFYNRIELLLDSIGLSWAHAHYGEWDVGGYRDISQGELNLADNDYLLKSSKKRAAPAASADTTTAKRVKTPTRQPLTLEDDELVLLDDVTSTAPACLATGHRALTQTEEWGAEPQVNDAGDNVFPPPGGSDAYLSRCSRARG